MNGAILELRNVVKAYGDHEVLGGVSFSVRRGETKIIIGASGSGKSTILKLVMGLEKPDEDRS
jgi:ABC-type sugar transport system ATPase subunit